MSRTQLTPNSHFDANLLNRLDQADGSSDGVIDTSNPEVRTQLAEAGITNPEALDEWDGARDGRLDMRRVRVSDGTMAQGEDGAFTTTGRSRTPTSFERRTSQGGRAQAYTAIVAARGEHMNSELARTLQEAGNWRSMTRAQHDSHFNRGGYDSDAAGSWLRGQIAELERAAAEATDPKLRQAAQAYMAFFTHLNASISNSDRSLPPEGEPWPDLTAEQLTKGHYADRGRRSMELGVAWDLLRDVNQAVSELPPEYARTQAVLSQGVDDFADLLRNFQLTAELAESASGQVANSAANQLAPYMVTTAFRHAQRLERNPEATIDDAVQSYGRDVEWALERRSRMRGVEARLAAGEFDPANVQVSPSDARAYQQQLAAHGIQVDVQEARARLAGERALSAYREAMGQAVGQASSGFRASAGRMAEAQFHARYAGAYFDRAAAEVTHGEQIIRSVEDDLLTARGTYASADTNIDAAQAHVEAGHLDEAGDLLRIIDGNVAEVGRQLEQLRGQIDQARAHQQAADQHIAEGNRHRQEGQEALDDVSNGRYARQFNGDLARLEVEYATLQRRYESLTSRSSELRRRVEGAESELGALRTDHAALAAEATTVGGELELAKAEAQRQAEEAALEAFYSDGRIHLREGVLTHLIHSFADENGETTRLDLIGGGRVRGTAQVWGGLAGGSAHARAFLEGGIDVRRGDTDAITLGVDVQLLVAAGVDVQALWGLLSAGAEVEYTTGGRWALRFATERDAARGLAILLDQVVRSLPSEAREHVEGTIDRPSTLPRPEHPVWQITESSESWAVRGNVRGGIPGTLEARLEGEGRTSYVERTFTSWGENGRPQRAEGFTEVTSYSGTFTVTYAADPLAIAGDAEPQTIGVTVGVAYEHTEGDPNGYNNGRYRTTEVTVSASGSSWGVLAGGGAPLVRLIGEMYGMRGATEGELRAELGSERFDMLREGIMGRARAAAAAHASGISVSGGITITYQEQAVGEDSNGERVYETQYTRVSSRVRYSKGVRTGTDGVQAWGGDTGAIDIQSRSGVSADVGIAVGVTSVENDFEWVPTGSRGATGYLIQNAGTEESVQDWTSFANDHRGAVEDAMRSDFFLSSVPPHLRVRVNGETVNAREYLAELRAQGDSMPTEGRLGWATARDVFHQLALQGVGNQHGPHYGTQVGGSE